MNVYQADECAVFFKTRELYGELSNMHNDFPLEWEDRIVESSEALYQAHKFDRDLVVTIIQDSVEHEIKPFEIVISQKNSMVSKMKAKKFRLHMRPTWHDEKLDVMDWVLQLKYQQHRAVLDAVLDCTGEMPIVEKSRKDQLWGAVNNYRGQLVGLNLLGELWMLIRSER